MDWGAASAEFVAIGGFAVIANRHIRTTRDVDLLIPDDRANDDACPFRVAGLASIVGFKRLADRPQDRADLSELESIHGTLPIDPIPSLDED